MEQFFSLQDRKNEIIDVVFDSLRGKMLGKSFEVIKSRGKMASVSGLQKSGQKARQWMDYHWRSGFFHPH
ncbi:hypothetical protein G6554_22285 [Bacillus sp. MM2020_4]|nr:hypothetical protein [Bacillus sp. MM2020_4]